MPEAKGLSEQFGANRVPSKPSEDSEGRLLSEVLLDSLNEAVVALDRQGRIVTANEAWENLMQECSWLERDEANGQLWIKKAEFKQACPETAPILVGVRNVMRGAQAEFKHEFALLQNGSQRWYRLRVKSLPQENLLMIALRDIALRRQAEDDLREAKTLFQLVTESTGDGFFMYDLEGRILMHNTAGMELLGVDSPIIGKTIEEIFPADLARTVRAQNELVMATERTLGYELTLDTPKGKRVALVQKGIYRNHQNKTVGVIGISRDITERKSAEETLKRSENHYRTLIEKSADAITLVAEDGVILYVSPPSIEITGFEPGELIGTNVFFWIHPEDIPETQQHFQELREMPGASITGECRSLSKSGQWKWLEMTATNGLNDPCVHAIVVNARDISERKKAEQELRRFEAIVESSLDGIFSVDLEGNVTSWNPAAQNIFGYSEGEMLGKDFKTLFREKSLGESSELNAIILRGKGIENCEITRFCPDGRRIDLSLTFSPIHNPSHALCGFAVIARDITERRRLEKEVLEISDFEKHRIGQDLHDDLCQHLVGISMIGNLLYAELARLGVKQAEDAKQITEMIRNAVDHARILAKGLSPLNIAQGGLMAGLEALVSNTEQLFRIPCYFECTTAVHIENSEVATHFYRIAQEALHNAVKHSQGTKAVIRLEAERDTVVVTIRDDGVGPPELKKRPSGSGLGMHTMNYRARIIGATLDITRNTEGGTDVVCRLPCSSLCSKKLT